MQAHKKIKLNKQVIHIFCFGIMFNTLIKEYKLLLFNLCSIKAIAITLRQD